MNKYLVYSFIIITYICIQSYGNKFLDLNTSFSTEKELINFALNVVENEDKLSKNLIVIYTKNNHMVDDFFYELSKNNSNLAVISVKLDNLNNNSTEIDNPNPLHPDLTLIFLDKDNYKKMAEVIFNIEETVIWKTRHRYLVIGNGGDIIGDDLTWIEDSFTEFWDKQVLRVAICFGNLELKLYSFDPFTKNFAIDISEKYNDISSVFIKKVRKMNNYPIVLYNLNFFFKEAFVESTKKDGREIWHGKDGFYYTTISEKLNSSLVIHNISDDFPADMVQDVDISLPMGDFVDALTETYDFDALANIGGVFPGYDDLDHIFESERNDLYIITPRSSELPRYLYIFLIIPMNVWIATFISLISVSFIVYFVRKSYNKEAVISDAIFDNCR